jgi:hypothetical protein
MTSFRSRLCALQDDLGIEPLHILLKLDMLDNMHEQSKNEDISPPFSCLSGFVSLSERDTSVKGSNRSILKERENNPSLWKDESCEPIPSQCAYTRALTENTRIIMQESYVYTVENALTGDVIVCGLPT